MSDSGTDRIILVVIDDNESDASDVTALEEADLNVVALAPSASVEECARLVFGLTATGPAAILIDYRLDSSAGVNYRGGSLAGAIRDLSPSIPLILYTTDAILHDEASLRAKARQAFDWVLEKDYFLSSPQRVRIELMSIARSFAEAHLEGMHDEFDSLMRLLTADQTQEDTVGLMNPGEQGSSPADLASWILNSVLTQDGPIVNSGQAAAALGLRIDRLPKYSTQMEPARYRGLFCEMEPRWWLSGLLRMLDPETFEVEDFAECDWCGGEVNRACAVCGEPCGEEHALPIVGAAGGGWTRGSVVCFPCVEVGRDSSVRIDRAYMGLANAIRMGQVDRESA